MFKMKTGVIAAILALAVSASAFAAPLTGGFSKTGNFAPVNGQTGAATTLQAATGIDFLPLISANGSTPGVPGEFLVNDATDDFAFLLGSEGLIRDFTFAGLGSANFPTPPVLGFEFIDGLTFDLLTVMIDFQNANFLLLSGTGLFTLAGFDPTPGTFFFSSQTAGQGTFTFSASQAADVVAVPEPASLGLLGMGLFGVAAAARRRRVRA